MISVYECLINNQVGFQVVDDDTGEIKVVSYTSYEVKNNYGKYHILYNSIMEPIETSFEFLNFHLSDRSENTKRKAAQALKVLFSYENIMSKKLKDFKQCDINNFKRFLHGLNTPGNTLNIVMTTVRSSSTVNAYLSIYRQYLSFIGEKNNVLNKKLIRIVISMFIESLLILVVNMYQMKR